jgi:hypothetical protein
MHGRPGEGRDPILTLGNWTPAFAGATSETVNHFSNAQ